MVEETVNVQGMVRNPRLARAVAELAMAGWAAEVTCRFNRQRAELLRANK